MSEIKTRVCTYCGDEKPLTNKYFAYKNKSKNIFDSFCKVCKSKISKQRNEELKSKPKEIKEYNVCIKCGRELPCNIIYFPPDNTCKTGFRNVCRECGKDGHFMEDGYIPKHWWSKEDEQILINNYAFYTNMELINTFFPNETNKSLQDKAWRLGITGKNIDVIERVNKEKSEKMSGENSPCFGIAKSEETKRKISESKKGKYKGINSYWFGKKRSNKQRYQISQRMKGKWSGDKNPRHINPLNGELNGRWQGGIKNLYLDLRDHLQDWKNASMKECNYKCVLTNGEFDNIHHLYSFKNIVVEVFDELQLPFYKTIGEYSEKDRNDIYSLLDEKHKLYGNGKCVCAILHKLFHDTYNYYNNSPEQWYEFCDRYKNNEFDDLLDDKYKYKNILKEVG